MIGADEYERLHVRLADLPGFDPVGLHVWYDGERILCVGMYDGAILLDDEGPDGEQLAALPEQCEVSTADARTRDALARWVAAKVGLCSACTVAPSWYGAVSRGGHTVAQGWQLYTPVAVSFFDRDIYAPDLDDDDPRLLPDGSRWVDAAALAAVARHAGGQP